MYGPQLTACCHNKNLWYKHAKLGEARDGGAGHDMLSTREKWGSEGGWDVLPFGEAPPWSRRSRLNCLCAQASYALTTRCVIGKLTNNLFIWIEEHCWLSVGRYDGLNTYTNFVYDRCFSVGKTFIAYVLT